MSSLVVPPLEHATVVPSEPKARKQSRDSESQPFTSTRNAPLSVGGVNSAREQDSSTGGGAGTVCLGVAHMEEEVQDRVQVEIGKRRAR